MRPERRAPTRGRRAADATDGRRFVRENWYRDVWLLVVSAVVVWSLLAIEGSRRDSVAATCRGQNERNVQTIAALEKVVTALPPARRRRALESVGSTVLLINALAPFHKDCGAYADAVLDGRVPPPERPPPLPRGLRVGP